MFPLRVIFLAGRNIQSGSLCNIWKNFCCVTDVMTDCCVTILEKEERIIAKKVALHKLPKGVHSGQVWIRSTIHQCQPVIIIHACAPIIRTNFQKITLLSIFIFSIKHDMLKELPGIHNMYFYNLKQFLPVGKGGYMS